MDVIHLTLEHLGYIGDEFAAIRPVAMMYGIYRKPGESIAVSWQSGSAVYALSATAVGAIEALFYELSEKGLACKPAGKRMTVYGQEHIDAEVMRMLQ